MNGMVAGIDATPAALKAATQATLLGEQLNVAGAPARCATAESWDAARDAKAQ